MRRRSLMNNDGELLVGLDLDELEALADGLLAPAAQTRLSDLLSRQSEQLLLQGEGTELAGLLRKVDHLTLLKSRARYTLQQARAEATGT